MGGFLAIGLGTGQGVYTQTGGTMTLTAGPVTNGAGAGSVGIINLGGNAVFNHSSPTANAFWIGEAGAGVLNVSGTAALNIPNNGLEIGKNNVATASGIVNLLGGTVTTNSISKPGAAATASLNFNGGTLVANIANASFLGGLNSTHVYSGGGSINNGGNAITIAQPLLAPAGSGVSATGLTTSGGGYISAPIVTISGDGTGATAVANIDANGNLTGITITNPGTGYTAPPTFTLTGGGIGNTGTIGGAPTLVANASGGLSFSGAAVTTLGGANTYTGNTAIASGSTVLLADNATLAFKPGANGSSNKVTGAGTAFFYGDFNIDTSAAAIANGNSWTLVDVTTRTFDALQFTVPGFTEAANVWTKVDGNNTWTFTEATGILSLSVSGGSPGYGTWIDGFGLAAGDKDTTDDADHDGFNNLLEYVLGGNPNQSGTVIAPTGAKSGSELVLTFTRNDVALTAADATMAVEYGNNLTGWTTVLVPAASSTVSGVVFNVTNGSPNDTITATVPNGGSGKFFARVRAVK
jgi:autotransporter-associated beta strand protein